jgi:anaerobic selenocysteine-containing dehydrogenase
LADLSLHFWEYSMKHDQHGVSRRQFVGGIAFLGSVNSLGALAGDEGTFPAPGYQPNTYDFKQQSAALLADNVVKSACQFCNSNCAVNVHIKNGRVIDIEGEYDDPVQQGGLCVKASMMTQLVYNRFRLKTPLKRVSGAKGSADSAFEAVSWDEALEIIAKKFIAIRDDGDAHTIANRTTGRMPRGAGSVIHRFFTLLGSPNDTDVGPVCNDAGGNALAWTFGMGNFTNGYGVDPITQKEDLGSANYFLFLGTNQAETHPVTFAHLLREREKTNAKLVVIDPRKTPTAEYADMWIAPKPHTDLAIALAMLHQIVTYNLYDEDFVDRWVIGFDELKSHLTKHQYTPEWAEGVTGVPQQTIRQIARDYATAKPAAIFCNAGISHQMNAFDTYRALAFLAAITGNIGQPGGGCNFMHNTWPGGLNLPPIDVTPPKIDHPALPVGPDSFADSILEAKPYRLRALMTEGNPLISSANTSKVKEAFQQLEFYIYTGLFMEEAAYYADVILPVPSGFEMETVYMRRDDRAIRWQHQAVAPVGECKPDQNIWIELAHKMEALDPKASALQWAKHFPLEWLDYRNLWGEFSSRTPGVGGMTVERMEQRKEPLRWPCPDVDHPGTSTMYLDHPNWYAVVEALNSNNRGKRFPTASGKVEIYTPKMDAKLKEAGHGALPVFYTHPEVTGKNASIRYSRDYVPNPINPHALTPLVAVGVEVGNAYEAEYPLMGMIGRPSVVHFAGVTQWTYTGKQMNGERLVQIHPTAAYKAGISSGDSIRVESPRGSIEATALVWDGIREDTVFVPNTFGPQQMMGDEFGLPRYEAANTLLDDQYFDNLSGQQAYKCFACRVVKV